MTTLFTGEEVTDELETESVSTETALTDGAAMLVVVTLALAADGIASCSDGTATVVWVVGIEVTIGVVVAPSPM